MSDVDVDAFILLQAFQERLRGGARHGGAHGGGGGWRGRRIRTSFASFVVRVVRGDVVETEESFEVRLGDVRDDSARV